MIRSTRNAWLAYLYERRETSLPIYQYPTEERLTDNIEYRQDPLKRQRELEMISSAITSSAEVVCDFGCGVGRNFEILRRSVSGDALFIAIEPDAQRASAAAQVGQNFKVVNGGIEIIEQAPQDCKIDHLLCCQVIGHTSMEGMERIVETILTRLSETGEAHFCIPFINSSLTDMEGDFFHTVNLNAMPEDEGFRTRITTGEFDHLVTRGYISDTLPVRAFSVLLSEVNIASSIPFLLEKFPDSFHNLIVDSFQGVATIYSVHARYDGIPYIGDVSIVVRRKLR